MWDVPSVERLVEGGTWVLAEASGLSQSDLTEAEAEFRRIGVRLRSVGRVLGLVYVTEQINTRNYEGDIVNTRWEVRFRGADAEPDPAS